MVPKEFSDASCVLDVTFDPQRHGFDSLKQQEGGERRQHGSGRALIHAAAPCDVGGAAEMIRINKPVIGGVGLIEHRETRSMILPGKSPAVDDGTAERGAM